MTVALVASAATVPAMLRIAMQAGNDRPTVGIIPAVPYQLSSPFRDMKTFEMKIRVAAEDIDEQDHVNNTVYLRWVQDVAVAHWRTLASEEAQKEIRWVVVRHEIDYKAPGSLGDEVILRTWVGEATRLRFERLTEILRSPDQRLLATARTLWVPINAATGKPTRVGAEVRAQFSV